MHWCSLATVKTTAARVKMTAARARSRRHFGGVVGLVTPEDCGRLARVAASASDALVEGIIHSDRPSSATLQALDDTSRTLCEVLDPLELARNVHPHRAFREAADAAYGQLAGRMAEYSTDERLYGAVRAVLADERVAASLSAEWHRFACCMIREFEHDGAHLPADERSRLRALQAREADLSRQFAMGAGARGAQGVWAPEWALEGLPAHLRAALPRREAPSGTLAHVPAERTLLTTALQHVHCEPSRRELYECREGLASSNLEVREKLDLGGPLRTSEDL